MKPLAPLHPYPLFAAGAGLEPPAGEDRPGADKEGELVEGDNRLPDRRMMPDPAPVRSRARRRIVSREESPAPVAEWVRRSCQGKR